MDRLLIDLLTAGAAETAAAGASPGTPASQPAAVQETIRQWIRDSRYVTGRELAAAGLAELVELKPLEVLRQRR
jgi:hypothetical protein